MIGKRLLELRKKNKLTRLELAAKVGVSVATIKNWENDSADPRIDNIKLLAKALCVSTDYLLEYSEEYQLANPDLDQNDMLVLNTMIQHILNLKQQK